MWLAQWRIAMARTKEDLASTLELLEWVSDVALPSGLLPEQLNPYTGAPISVAPLTWSHAAFVTTISLYLEVLPETTASLFDMLKPELSPSLA
jgi:GH15 family glucan-1,4-alpha-glucosidase